MELALPFEITVAPVAGSERGALRYETRLGDIRAEGRQEWDEARGEFAPVMRAEKGATVSAAIVHGVAGECYGEVELSRDGLRAAVGDCGEDRGTWRLAGEDGRVRCVALVTGPMAQPGVVAIPPDSAPAM